MSAETPDEQVTPDVVLESAVLRAVCDQLCDDASVHGACVGRARRIVEVVAPLLAARVAAARDEGRAEGDRCERDATSWREVVEHLIAEVERLRDELAGARADLEYLRNPPAPVADLRAEVAAAQQILNLALDGEEVSRGDLAYDVDTVADQRDEARQEIARLTQARSAEAAAKRRVSEQLREAAACLDNDDDMPFGPRARAAAVAES